VVLCCGPVRLALPIGPSPRLRVPAFRHLNQGHAAMGPPWPSAAHPASMPGCPLLQAPPRGLLEGASRTGPQQRTSGDLRRCFLKANRHHKYHCSAFESALGSPPHPAGRVEARLRRESRHGCRLSPAGPRKAHRGVPCASVPERGHPEPKRRANAGAATPRPARKQNHPTPRLKRQDHWLSPPNICSARRLTSSGVKSSMRVATNQRIPNGSRKVPLRFP